MNYKDLLEKEEWYCKRSIILERDFKECQECKNLNIIRDTFQGNIIQMILLDNKFAADANQGDLRFPRFRLYKPKYKLLYNFNNVDYEIYAYIDGWHDLDKLNALYNSKIYLSYDLKDMFNVNSEKTLTVRCIENCSNSENKWFYVYNLHVHHTFYQDGKLPWDYPDNSLQTLCWMCHEKLHKNNTIPWINMDGDIIGEKTYCYRCHGAGIFPQYQHVQNGICFRCNGGRFEVFI
jgi:hypothetical protein